MDFMQLVSTRHSVRSFRPDPIPQEVLNDILEAGRMAPALKIVSLGVTSYSSALTRSTNWPKKPDSSASPISLSKMPPA